MCEQCEHVCEQIAKCVKREKNTRSSSASTTGIQLYFDKQLYFEASQTVVVFEVRSLPRQIPEKSWKNIEVHYYVGPGQSAVELARRPSLRRRGPEAREVRSPGDPAVPQSCDLRLPHSPAAILLSRTFSQCFIPFQTFSNLL